MPLILSCTFLLTAVGSSSSAAGLWTPPGFVLICTSESSVIYCVRSLCQYAITVQLRDFSSSNSKDTARKTLWCMTNSRVQAVRLQVDFFFQSQVVWCIPAKYCKSRATVFMATLFILKGIYTWSAIKAVSTLRRSIVPLQLLGRLTESADLQTRWWHCPVNGTNGRNLSLSD